jgi:hypothetical protein
MRTEVSGIVRVALFLATAIGYGLAQKTDSEKHVKDIRKEQPRTAIAASPLCQRTRENPQGPNMHEYKVDPSTMAPDLDSLIEKSDDVILTTALSDVYEAIAPSGDDVVQYMDVKVMRVWKGSHKPGDMVTFAIPFASVDCSPAAAGGGARFASETGPGYWVSLRGISESYILFLRHSQGNETQLTPGLRLTGGSGMQGMYPVQFPFGSQLMQESRCQNNISGNKYPENAKLCMGFLESSDLPIATDFRLDPLLKKYDRMPISEFLKEVQDAADSLGHPPQSETK